MEKSADYGIDSPTIVAGLLLAGAAGVGLTAAVLALGSRHVWVIFFLFAVGVYFLSAGMGMLFYSKDGKLRVRDEILGAIPWRRDEWVLGVGCGRGLLTVGAARLLTAGRAVGIDVWKPADLSGNRRQAVLETPAPSASQGASRCLVPTPGPCLSESQSSWLTTLLNFGMVRAFRVTGTKPRLQDSAVPLEERGTSVFT